MLTGIVLAVADVPLVLIEEHNLAPRIIERGGLPEVQFLFHHAERVRPVWHEDRTGEVGWIPLLI
jgi:hypothetical protein